MGWLSLACFVLAAMATSAFGSDPPKPPPPQPPPDTGAADAAAAAERQKAQRRRGRGATQLTDPRGAAGDYAALGGGPDRNMLLDADARAADTPSTRKTKLGG